MGSEEKKERGKEVKLTDHASNPMQRSLALLLDRPGARARRSVEHFGVDGEALLCVWRVGR